MRGILFLVGATMVAACTDAQLSAFDAKPQVSILAPEEAQHFEYGLLVEFVGITTDGSDTEALDITWSSDRDGRLGGDAPDADGNVYWPANDLTEGAHIVTLEAVDSAGQKASSAVGITVGEEGVIIPEDPEAPTVILSSPANLATPLRDEVVNFVGTVTDPQQAPETLAVTLSSSADGLLWEGAPSITGGITFDSDELTIGVHDIVLTAVDDDGNIGSDEAKIEVLNDGRPFAEILAPTIGTVVLLGDSVTFEGTIWDLEDDPIDLNYQWSSDLDGVVSSGFPDSAGYTAFATTALTAGTHLMSLMALDTDGQNAADSLLVEVQDPNGMDLDVDGYTPLDGDCDDGDATVNPGATEVCDLADNDCNGLINDGFEDAYETAGNDTHATMEWLGGIDNESIGFETVTLAGLTLHTDIDEDWFGWDADDDWYDDVNIDITATMPATGSYVVELYWDDGGTLVLRDSIAGNGTLLLHAQGSTNPFDEDEDDWVVRVFATPGGWDPGACSGSYTIEIRS